MAKLFLYDPGSVTQDTLTVMNRKKYVCTELTSDPDFFWKTISNLEKDSVFVLLSHGDKNGPLAVKGNQGNDINLDDFAKVINDRNLTLYLLSCHTGQNPCGSTLEGKKLNFVAPKGFAVFQTTGNETVNVYSKEGNDYPGWAGPLSPNRSSKALSLP